LTESPQRSSDRLQFLLDASGVLASSLDFEETLDRVAQLAIRSMADFCIIDVVEDGEIKRLHVGQIDPALNETTRRLLRFPVDPNRPHLSSRVLATGASVIIPEVGADLLDSLAQDSEHRETLAALRPRSVMAIPLSAHGRVLGVLLFVSATRSYDNEDLQLAEKLGQLAGLEIDNARLYREAQKALEARDRILGIVAHDLRNPLNVISMSAELLLDSGVAEDRRAKQLQVILRSANRMNRLIQDLLDVARIEGDRLLLQVEEQLPERLVQEAVELSAALAIARGIALRTGGRAESSPIYADRDRILQVLANLIDNSIKFTPAGGEVEVSVEPRDDGVCFRVSDSGPGIAPGDLNRIFEPFWQAKASSLEGAGLGLMIARGIVEAHGGRIWAESTLGQGSTFHFTIPAQPNSPNRRRGPADRRGGRSRPESEDPSK
jgi:signal transduction histidine kinase